MNRLTRLIYGTEGNKVCGNWEGTMTKELAK